MKKDSIQILRDSLKILSQTQKEEISQNISNTDYFNYIVGVIGVLSAIISAYAFYQSYKSKKLQDFVFKQAQTALEKESTQEKLNQTKKELNSVESKLSELQKQIQKDLPIEARKAVLKDRLEESMENLKKYYDDVTSIKLKLSNLGEDNIISEEILKSIQQEIEPRFVIKEKISNYKTYLTIVSTLAGIVFAIAPYPLGKYLGGTLLLIGFPIAIQLIRFSIVKNSKDKQSTNLKLRFWASILATLISTCCAIFFWLIVIFETGFNQKALINLAFFLTIITMLSTFMTWKIWKKNKLLNKKV